MAALITVGSLEAMLHILTLYPLPLVLTGTAGAVLLDLWRFGASIFRAAGVVDCFILLPATAAGRYTRISDHFFIDGSGLFEINARLPAICFFYPQKTRLIVVNL